MHIFFMTLVIPQHPLRAHPQRPHHRVPSGVRRRRPQAFGLFSPIGAVSYYVFHDICRVPYTVSKWIHGLIKTGGLVCSILGFVQIYYSHGAGCPLNTPGGRSAGRPHTRLPRMPSVCVTQRRSDEADHECRHLDPNNRCAGGPHYQSLHSYIGIFLLATYWGVWPMAVAVFSPVRHLLGIGPKARKRLLDVHVYLGVRHESHGGGLCACVRSMPLSGWLPPPLAILSFFSCYY